MLEWFKHWYMFKILNNLTISYFKVPVHPFGFATVPVHVVSSLSMVSSVCRPKFMDEEKPLHIWTDWTGCNWICTDDIRKPVCDGDDGCWCSWLMKTSFWYWILVLDKDVEHRMTDDLGYIFDECGRFSISSWLVVALPQKLKIT